MQIPAFSAFQNVYNRFHHRAPSFASHTRVLQTSDTAGEFSHSRECGNPECPDR